MNRMKKEKDVILKDELPGLVGAQKATGVEQRYSSKGMKSRSQRIKNPKLWICLVMKVKSDAVKNKIAWEPGKLGP